MDRKRSHSATPSSSDRPGCCPCWRKRASASSPVFLNSYNYPGQALHDEIGLYVRYGLTLQQALQSAVVNGPRFLGKLDRYGSIDSGKAADLLVLDADPLADIGATRRIHLVVSRGQPYDRARLDRMLDEVRRKVAAQ